MTINHNFEIVYQKSKEAYLGLISNKEAAAFLVTERNLNPNSAITVIRIFQKMLIGETFTRTLSVEHFEYFLYRIYTDMGIAKLDLAINSINKHIFYIKTKGDSKVTLKGIVRKYSEKILHNAYGQQEIKIIDENEQEEIADFLQGKSKSEIIEQLKQQIPIEPEIIILNGKTYKRDNKTVAQIKFIRDYKCQICSSFVLKANGKKYIEAAHIIPKALQGEEVLSNILILCPNHHKEFDMGNRETLSHDENQIHFILNGKEFHILFSH